MGYLNIAGLATVLGTTSATSSLPTTGVVVLSAPPTNHTFKVNTIMAANKSVSNATITLVLNRNSTNYYMLAYQVLIPTNSTLVLIGKDNPFYMYDVSSDILSAASNTANAVDLLVSYEELF